jgi:general secretion pathway protein J
MRPSTPRHAATRGLTLLEVMVSVAILALVGTLIYGAFDGMSRSRYAIDRLDDRYRQGRGAISRMGRELQDAFLSMHQPLVVSDQVRTTAFIGKKSTPADRVDFTSFSHMRLGRNLHESDQNEVGYFGARDPDRADKTDLVRREDRYVDLDPDKGGVINVLAEDIQSFEVTYLDPLTAQWTDNWDSTQAASQFNRLPLQVKLNLILNGGVGGAPIRMQTKVPLAMQTALSFAALAPGNTGKK